MSIGELIAITAAEIAILTAAAAGIRWLVKHYLAELRPNGGSSLNDTIKLEILPIVKAIQTEQQATKISIANLEGRFDQHVIEAKE